MNVLLINPPRFRGIPVIREDRCEITDRYSVIPPYSLLQIASLLRKIGNKVDLVDANGENLTYNEIKEKISEMNYDILLFRFTPTTFDWDLKITNISKEINKDALTAGICWTLRTLPTEILMKANDLDIYIMHEYEIVVPSLLSSLMMGVSDLSNIKGIAYRNETGIHVNQPSEPLYNYDSIPIPAYDLLRSFKPYYANTRHGSPFTIIYTSKGCPFKCIYCTVAKTRWRARSANSILNELRHLKSKYNIKTVAFFDETFTIDRQRVIEISRAIKDEIGISWYCNTRVDLIDQELLNIMKEGGCKGISYGIESGSQAILDLSKKNITVEEAENAIQLTKKSGIKTYCSFLFGLPGENWQTAKETIKFVKKNLPTSAQFNVAVPYPGTEFYDIALEKGLITDSDFKNLFHHEAIVKTEELTADDLNKIRKMAYKALYFNSKWWIQNILHILKNPEDFSLAMRYALKIFDNYLIRKMEHSH
jgi:radical SAM superfamily enzyme YgiQ (UPF0313 family)